MKSPAENKFDAPDLKPDEGEVKEKQKQRNRVKTVEQAVQSAWMKDDGGVRGVDKDGKPSNVVYYMGIIDILIKWSAKKRVENIFKGISYDRKTISAVKPVNYGKRFEQFMSAFIKK